MLPEKRRQPVIAPGGLLRLAQVVALIALSVWVSQTLFPIWRAAFNGMLSGVGIERTVDKHGIARIQRTD